MGCVSSALLEEDGAEDDRRRIISHHHIVSLTSSTYGILTSPRAYCSSSSSSTAKPIALGPEPLARCAPPPPPPPLPPPPTTARQQAAPAPKPESQPQAEVINSWELMAGLVDPSTPAKPTKLDGGRDHQRRRRIPLRAIDGNSSVSKASPPPSSSAVVLYTTSLRGVRVTFEACNAVRAALQAHGVAFRERDVSMDRGFRDELRSRLGGGRAAAAAGMLPRLFVRGRHVGGAEDVLRLDEEGLLARLLEGLPRARGGAYCCDGCGGMRFLPCFDCSGSRKLAVTLPVVASSRKRAGTVVVRCGECNENGLVLCPICS